MIEISEPTRRHGQTNDSVRVVEGGALELHGQLNGDVIVEAGGFLDQHGQVNGDVHGYGAVELSGMVNGELHAYEGSQFNVAEGTMFGSQQLRYVTSDGRIEDAPTSGTVWTSNGPARFKLHPDGTLSPV